MAGSIGKQWARSGPFPALRLRRARSTGLAGNGPDPLPTSRIEREEGTGPCFRDRAGRAAFKLTRADTCAKTQTSPLGSLHQHVERHDRQHLLAGEQAQETQKADVAIDIR